MPRAGGRDEELPPPRKRLGQHFLNDPRILDRIVDALAPRPDETVIEIGPGRGSLTARIAPRCARLIAIELDRTLAPRLREAYAAQPHVTVVEADVLDVNLGALAGGPYALVGNVPYYITTPILFHALARPRAARAVYLMQREVADRLVATAGSDAYGALSVNAQAVARVQRLFLVGAGAFTPPPKVESAVVCVIPRDDPVVGPDEEDGFRRFVQAAFAQRRKQLKSFVRSVAGVDTAAAIVLLESVGLRAEERGENLTPAQFAALYRAARPRQGERRAD